jgi:hypothetical protein
MALGCFQRLTEMSTRNLPLYKARPLRNKCFPAYCGTDKKKQFQTICREFIEWTFQFLVEAVLHIISFIVFWGLTVETNDMEPASDLSVLCTTSYQSPTKLS